MLFSIVVFYSVAISGETYQLCAVLEFFNRSSQLILSFRCGGQVTAL